MKTLSEPDPWSGVFGRQWPGHAARHAGLSKVQDALFGSARTKQFGDRYRIVAARGSGGYGVVYEAEDLTLGRRVAIKVPSVRGDGRSHMVARFVREANALARVEHPNVVPIFDIGYDEHGDPFFAMELVEGVTLGAWGREPGRTRQEILHAYLSAGRGLAAVHAAGLTHRDFKPHNVLVSANGTVRVCDFGLAVLSDAGAEVGTKSSDTASCDSRLESTGTIAGTPRYMSPEQHRGAAAGPASDQFAFCTALLEGLTGTDALSGVSYSGLLTAKQTGSWSGEALARVDRRLAAVLRRGLDPVPANRWPSMEALVVALSRAAAPSRRPVRGAAVLALGLAVVASIVQAPQPASGGCEGLGAVESTLADARVESLRRAYADFGAEDTWRRAAPRVAGFRRQWSSAFAEICRMAPADPVEAAERRQCLEAALVEADSILDALAAPDEATVHATMGAMASIPSIKACASAQTRHRGGFLFARGPAAADLMADLPRVRALASVGKFQRALDLAQGALARAHSAESDVAIASIAVTVGTLRLERGTPVASVAEEIKRAYFLARESGDDATALRAAIMLTHVYTAEIPDLEEAQRWGRATDSLATSIGPSDRVELFLLLSRARLAMSRRDVDAAVEQMRALDVASAAVLGERNPERIPLRWSLGVALSWAERLHEASEVLESTLELADTTLAHDHPDRARVRLELGEVKLKLGQRSAARSLYAAAEEILDAAGPLPRDDARLHLLRGILERDDGELGRAQLHTTAAIDGYVALVGENSALVFQGVNNLGLILLERGRVEEALRAFARAELIVRRTEPNSALEFGLRINTAKARFAAGRVAAAREQVHAALEDARSQSYVSPAAVVTGMRLLGEFDLDAGLYDDAIGSFHAVLSAQQGVDLPPGAAVEPLILLSLARLGQGKECAARAIARRVTALLDDLPEPPQATLDLAGELFAKLDALPDSDGRCE